MKSRKAWMRMLALLSLTLIAVSAVLGAAFYRSADFEPALLSREASRGLGALFLDRTGRELRFSPGSTGERRRWVALAEVPGVVSNAFIAAEDERFYRHHGFDAVAILRAIRSNVAEKRIVSGASTISQQLVRLAYGGSVENPNEQDGGKSRKKRSYREKLIEVIRSVKLERALTKDEILEQYLNRVPMGNNLVGIETAARTYFGTSVKNLSVAEAALLASLPKAPGALNPYGSGKRRLLARRDWVLSRMAALGMLDPAGYRLALEEKPRLRPLEFVTAAPHVVDMLTKKGATSGIVRTTLDLDLQQRVQEIVASHENRLHYRGASQAAAIVIDNPGMEVLAAVGSIEYSGKNDGYNNGVLALRSAGSTLKPLLYALAIESGDSITTLLQDTERKYRSREGQYSPLNFDRKEYGPVTMRAALGNSLNLSAVKMLERVGEERFYELLQRANLINHPERGPGHYGLGMAIGNPEVSPEQLATAFAMFANNGVYRPATYVKQDGIAAGPRGSTRSGGKQADRDYILLPQTAYIITDILSDTTARSLTFSRTRLMMDFPFRVALKTGTSTFYRDLWAVGYTTDYTVAVWVGNFDGSPTKNLSGSSAAVPIFADIMSFLYRQSEPAAQKRPKGIRRVTVCGYSGMKPSPFCAHTIKELFIAGTVPKQTCTFHTNDARRHDLSASYAGWLYNKNRTGSAGRFRLSGFGNDLNSLFQDPWEGVAPEGDPGVKLRSGMLSNIQASSPANLISAEAERRYHIGAALPEPAVGSVSNTADGEIRIVYPLDGDRFVMNRQERNQIIKLQAIVARSVPYVDWFLNGKFLKRTGPPYQAYWPLEEGRHHITAVLPTNVGDSVRVSVE